jgi:serine kinase of HPr protein (carbohydrate metabolism regulator)
MSGAEPASVHASAVLVGDRAVLIRGASGAGKSRLAFDLILAGRAGQIAPALLVGDDRVELEARHGVLLVRPVHQLVGLIEVRGLGVRSCAHAAEAIVGLVVDLDAADGDRLPEPDACRVTLAGVELPRIPVEPGFSPLPLVVAALTTTEGSLAEARSDDCPKGIGNHMRRTLATD